jgi:LmbE family N-acetylglucosaminyl deacetylase
MTDLTAVPLTSVAVVGARCGDVAMGAGAALMDILRGQSGAIVHALILTGGGSEREIEEKNAFAAVCGNSEVRLTVADLPEGELSLHRAEVRKRLADFRASCEPDVVFAPHRAHYHLDHRVVAELTPTEFRDHLVLGYELLEGEADLFSPSIYLPINSATAWRKCGVLNECYPSQLTHDWFDDDAFLGLMRVRGVQCRSRYAEAFVVEKEPEEAELYSRN